MKYVGMVSVFIVVVTVAPRVQRHGRRDGGQPSNDDYYVRYEDRWYWDMRTFLQDLRIDVHEAGSGNVIGYDRSFQNSLSATGMTLRDVIDRALDALLESE